MYVLPKKSEKSFLFFPDGKMDKNIYPTFAPNQSNFEFIITIKRPK